MKRLLLNFFLTFCLLQSFGFTQLNAHTVQEERLFAAIDLKLNDHKADLHQNIPFHTLRTFSASPGNIVGLIIENVEEEQYEATSSKKHLESNNYFFAHFYAETSEFSFRNSRNTLISCKHPFVIQENGRAILFQVFRL